MGKLVLWELGKKQSYIFRSNKLIDSIGASLIIKDFSEDFTSYSLKDECFIMKGGGKTLYFFEDSNAAQEFIKSISKAVLNKFEGLELIITSINYLPEQDELKQKISDIYEKLERRKNERVCYQIGFGIERKCEYTGLPSSKVDEEQFISSEIHNKREYARINQEKNFIDLIPKGYKLVKVIEDLVHKDAKQYISVIHIDGNQMGLKVQKLTESIKREAGESIKDFNNRYAKTLRKFSETINLKYKNAFKKMCSIITENNEVLNNVTRLSEKKLPIRPIILAGDDITYIANGYIAVESARIMLELLDKEIIEVNGKKYGKLNSCAGIATIKKGYPFIKGYNLAEELCSNAKKLLLQKNIENVSALDFHIIQGDTSHSINEIRDFGYSIKNGDKKLTTKPLIISKEAGVGKYRSFKNTFDTVVEKAKDSKVGRNKIKSMRDVLVEGKVSTENYFKFYNIPEHLGAINSATDNYGFSEDGTCLLLDAIEVMDLFIPLKWEV